jgi:hypothetical protein
VRRRSIFFALRSVALLEQKTNALDQFAPASGLAVAGFDAGDGHVS